MHHLSRPADEQEDTYGRAMMKGLEVKWAVIRLQETEFSSENQW
jgi:hypothetical protein